MYIGLGGVGKFTHPYHILKYVPKLHQTLYFVIICDEGQKTKSEFEVSMMTSSYSSMTSSEIGIFKGHYKRNKAFSSLLFSPPFSPTSHDTWIYFSHPNWFVSGDGQIHFTSLPQAGKRVAPGYTKLKFCR